MDNYEICHKIAELVQELHELTESDEDFCNEIISELQQKVAES